ncbi:MAG TPA: DUF4178 domain-containing protein [Luteitalea sp.]|nr:DUF4178 domain-containing protein [Luteitalea sp.]
MVNAPGTPRTRGFNCANCGGAVELRALAHTRSVTCTTCGSLLDPRDPNVVILQEAARRESITPTIPLGTRGTWHGQPYEVIGFQRRSITVDGTQYSWDEYVLFNPFRGFRYLTDYQGHWNDVRTIRELPVVDTRSNRPTATHDNRKYTHFQHAQATTDFVIGEFPWRVTLGDQVVTDDFVEPPYMLSSEGTEQERTWSLGTYTPGETIWKAFGLPGAPPEPVGVFANQPNPYKKGANAGCTAFFVLFGLLVALFLLRMITADRERVFSSSYTYQPGAPEASFVTAPFTLSDDGTISIEIDANVSNNWLGFDVALINIGTGTAYNTDKELEFYFGTEGGESWTEGSRSGSMFLPSVPAGEYYLRVEPEGPAGIATGYTLRVVRDVPSKLPYAIALVCLLFLPFLTGWRSGWFEQKRQAESDYGSSSSDDDDDDED